MSRIGKKPVYLSEGVTAEIKSDSVLLKGPKGELALTLHPLTSVEQKQDDEGKTYLEVVVQDTAEHSAIWGTMRSIIENMERGVKEGWTKSLELNGVGFRMNLQGKVLVMNLGFSHEVRYEIPQDLEAAVEGNVLKISGVDLQRVGQVAAEIRALKKPEPYKGKGFRYVGEEIRRKAGKAAKSD